MPAHAQIDVAQLEALVAPAAARLGYELVDLEWKHESGHWVLRVFIDWPEGSGNAATLASDEALSAVGLEDCARASHLIGDELDQADVLQVPFHLEVSSPGVERPLKKERDFVRFAGRKARVRTRKPMSVAVVGVESVGRRNFTGRLVGAAEGRLQIDCDGEVYTIPVEDVEKAHLEFEIGGGAVPAAPAKNPARRGDPARAEASANRAGARSPR